MELMEAIRARRSVRSYKPDTVEPDKLDLVLEAARLAPSWKNQQCWNFIVIENKDIIQKVVDLSSPKQSWIKAAPALIIVCGNPEASGKRNNMDYYLADAALAFENLMLAAASLGLGTCWIGVFDEEPLKNFLQVPKNQKIVGFTPLGYPADKMNFSESAKRFFVKSDLRKPLLEIVHKEKW
jgi:nitroreductase